MMIIVIIIIIIVVVIIIIILYIYKRPDITVMVDWAFSSTDD